MNARVTTLELFFDLVFVFAITQVAHLVGHAYAAVDVVRALLVLAVVWWMYGGYAWLTNNIAVDRVEHRLLLLGAMTAFLVVALRIPLVAGRHGPAFGLAYLVIVLVHAALFTRAPNVPGRAVLSILPFNLLLGVLVVASGMITPPWNWIPWSLAGLAIVATTLLQRERDFSVSPSHFVERHGLVVLIALGESVVAVGTGAMTRALSLATLAALVLGIALAATIWWTYFDADDVRAEHAMSRASGTERARLAIRAYYYAHLVMIAGIVTAAAGMAQVVASAGEAASGPAGWLLASGSAAYLVGESAFRRSLRLGPVRERLVAALLVLATAPLAPLAGSVAQLSAIVTVMIVMLVMAG